MKIALKTSLTAAVLLGFAAVASLPAPVREPQTPAPKESRVPPAPLFRDPVFDGAADPSLIWNDRERTWWAFYTNRRANAPDAQEGVRWCHGTDIGIASSPDGQSWTYRGTARGLEFEPGRNTFWAPCLLEHGEAFHMFVAYVRGVPADWSGERHIVHYTSRDLVNWKYEAVVPLSSPNVIDAFVAAKPSGGWRMWYKDEAHDSHIWAADSEDLFRWSVRGPVVSSVAQEGPAVFWWRGSYRMFVDRWQGMAVLRSDDLEHWTEQPGTILGVPGTRPDDADIGRHGEVLVQGPDAYLFYFTHPFGPKEHVQPGKHRSSLQVARLQIADGKIVCDRNKPFDLELGPPSGFKPKNRLESPLELRTSDPKLAAAFAWAKGQALDYVFPAETYSDPVGGWYEAALPHRFGFCMRDVSHQATGAHVLGLDAINLNMLRKFVEGIAASRRYCSYWEIDKGNRPAPVDYKNDADFWYNLPANFDVMDACWRQYQWTGNRAYIEDPAFLGFYRLSATSYISAWDNDGDGVPDHRMADGNRGLGSYDEGPLSDRTAAGADLLAAEARAFLSYAGVLRLRGDTVMAVDLEKKAAAIQGAFYRKWWSPKLGRFAGLMLEGGVPNFDDLFWYGVFPLYFGFLKPGPERDAIIGRLAGAETDGVEVESYLPEVFYRYGRNEAAYTEVLRLSDPGKKRREYPEVPFALIGAVATGAMGIEPDGAGRTVATRSRLTAATEWAELVGVPVFGNSIDVRHDGKGRSTFTNRSGPALTWRAAFDGKWKELTVDGRPMEASQGSDEGGRDTSWVSVDVPPGRTITVAAAPGSAAGPAAGAVAGPRWSEGRARAWAESRPWILGCNYIPRTAINTLEMWQAGTFDPETIDQELGWAESLGFNAVRVFLHYLLWEQDRAGFGRRLEEFLAIADRHRIGTMFVLFDDCWNDVFALGPQPAPRPGVHNSGWVRCPGTKMLGDPSRWGVLEDYTKGLIGHFRNDRRVLAWDLYNEPANPDSGPKTLPLLKKVFDWARASSPAQPLTVGVWDDAKELEELNLFQAGNSDIVSFHSYLDAAGTKRRIETLSAYQRPLICTEYMARTSGSRFDNILPLFKSARVGAMNWGLVSGKTQTIFPWASKEGSPEPAVWHHDIFRPDGTPFSEAEVRVIREAAGVLESSRLTAEVDAYLQPFLDAGGFSGAVLMAKGGRVLVDKGYGLASEEFGIPNTPRTKFQIASLSKTFTAAAIMMLEERGQLSVRDPLARFIPDYPAGDKITIHHLLTHTSGISNVNDFPEYDRESRFPQTLPQIIAMFKDKPLRFPPGDRYDYSNSNYNLLAFVIEKVSGLSYGDFLERNIFGPLGMKDTAHRGSDGVIVPGLATGYAPSGAWGLERAPFLDWTIKTGNGSLYSTVDDLYKWDRALHDGKILSRHSLDAMFTDHASGMGYGWFVGKRSGRSAVRFSGRSPGYTSYLERYIDNDACIIILSNNYAPVPYAAIDSLRGILFGEPYTPLVMDKEFKADRSSLETYAGRYKFGADYYRPNAVVEIKLEAGDLTIVWSETYKSALRPLAKGVFLNRLFWATLIFQTDAEGKVSGFVWRDTKDYPAVRVNPPRGIPQRP